MIKYLQTILLCVLLTNCNHKPMKKFDWLAGGCTPKNYPIHLYTGNYIFEDGNQLYIPVPYKGDGDGWGSRGTTHVVGEQYKPIPIRLTLYWMSFAEKKWYQGSWELPQKKIIALFEKGFIDRRTNKKDNYTKIVTGMAPNGVVVVWLSGAGYVKEVARFQAEEATWPSMEKLMPGNPTISKEQYLSLNSTVEAYLAKNGIPTGLWDYYRIRYNWHPKINLLDEGTKLKIVASHFFNGELETWVVGLIDGWETRAIPKRCVIHWETKLFKYTTIITLDDRTIFNTFQTAFGSETNQRADFTVTLENRKVKDVFLQIGAIKTPVIPKQIKQYKYPKKNAPK
ncbi:DUF2931 family protein [Tenacibaculum maritimum]|uniref:DUF2931 family protein n=3 Tax=Tenacibaculum maritimum TaxID=107401 RepID=UPI003876B0BA